MCRCPYTVAGVPQMFRGACDPLKGVGHAVNNLPIRRRRVDGVGGMGLSNAVGDLLGGVVGGQFGNVVGEVVKVGVTVGGGILERELLGGGPVTAGGGGGSTVVVQPAAQASSTNNFLPIAAVALVALLALR